MNTRHQEIHKEIREKLGKAFPGADVKIEDESDAHAGHGSSGFHLAVEIRHETFAGKPLIEQHRLVHEALKEELREKIHALRLKTSTNG